MLICNQRVKNKHTQGKGSMSRREEGIRVKSRSHPQPLPAEHTGHASWFKSTRMPQRDQQHTRACTGCVPIPTSNIRLLCLTYTFSPFIRLIRLFWKKWRREGKVRDTVVTGTNATSHAIGMAAERKHAETSEHGRQTMTHHTLVWVVFFFVVSLIFYLRLELCIFLLVRLAASRKSGR